MVPRMTPQEPPDPPLLAAAGFSTLWCPTLHTDAVLLTDEKVCILRTGLPQTRLAQVVDNIWDEWWAEYGDAAIDQLTAEILTGHRPECPHISDEADPRTRAEDHQ